MITKAISKDLMCVKMRSGIEIWIEKEKAQRLIDLLGTTETKFVEIENEVINSASVEGVFTPQTMEDLIRRRNGQWQKDGRWHNRGDKVCGGCGNLLPYGKFCGICK